MDFNSASWVRVCSASRFVILRLPTPRYTATIFSTVLVVLSSLRLKYVPGLMVSCRFHASADAVPFSIVQQYKAGTFETCDSDNQDPVGVYTSNGVVSTYTQPPEGVQVSTLPAIKTPSSSNCVTYTSSVIYSQEPGASSSASSSSTGSAGTVTSKPTNSASSGGNKGSTTSQSSKSGAAMRGVSVPGGDLWAAGSGVFIAMGMTLIAGLMTVVVAL